MNQLQDFMARCNTQARPLNQEAAELNGSVIYGTFGDPVLMPVMTRQGYMDHLVTPFKAARDQFADDPQARQTLVRPLTQREFFIQIVDYTNPVVYTFILTDREL